MVRVTQASKMRSDPNGQYSPYGTPMYRAAPGEYAPAKMKPNSAPAAHRQAPIQPRSHFIGVHLQTNLQGPRDKTDTESRAVERALAWESRCRVVERRLEETLLRIPTLQKIVLRQESTITALKERLEDVEHGLDVAQSRIWQPGVYPPGSERDRRLTLQHRSHSHPALMHKHTSAASVLDELELSRPIAVALMRAAPKGEAEIDTLRAHAGKSQQELVALLSESGVLEDIAATLADKLLQATQV